MFSSLDWFVLLLYFAALFGIALWVIRKKNDSPDDYFLAGRHVGWFVIGASIFASNVGSEHIVGLAGSAAKDGLVMGHYELHSYLCLLLGWVFVPFYLRSGVFTMPEFLERRYDKRSRWLLSITMLIAYVLTKISVTIYAGAIVFKALLGIDFLPGALTIVGLTGVYTVLGGMRAVVYTEALQAIILIVGSVAITFYGLNAIGGFDELVQAVGDEKLNMFKAADHPEYPWTGILFAAPIVGLWYWCTDQYIVQRVLAAKNEHEARRGTIFAGYLKLLPFFIFMFPGLVALGLMNSGKMVHVPSDEVFPTLVQELLPAGVRGLVAGGLIAALMSSLAAVFNSSSTLFTMDIYKMVRPGSGDRELVRVGRIATVVLVVLGLLWIPLLETLAKGHLYGYLQKVQAYIAPPIAAVFFLGVFSKRINANGAIATFAVGFVLGMGRLVTELEEWPWIGPDNFFHFAIFLFLICVAVLVVVSLLTAPPREGSLRGLTFGTTVADERESSRESWNWTDVMHSVVILAVIATVLCYFSPLNF